LQNASPVRFTSQRRFCIPIDSLRLQAFLLPPVSSDSRTLK
jgi:hypothetical protein